MGGGEFADLLCMIGGEFGDRPCMECGEFADRLYMVYGEFADPLNMRVGVFGDRPCTEFGEFGDRLVLFSNFDNLRRYYWPPKQNKQYNFLNSLTFVLFLFISNIVRKSGKIFTFSLEFVNAHYHDAFIMKWFTARFNSNVQYNLFYMLSTIRTRRLC